MPAVHKRTDMTYLTRIQQLNSANLAEYRPLILDGDAVGLIWEHNLARLQAHGIALREEGARYIWDAPADFAARNRLLANLAAALYRSGYISGWRDEKLPLLASLHHPARALIERAAAPVLGVCGYGVHANGITERDGVPHMWIARRAASKSVEPGKLDQIAAGGIPHGIGILANLIKESGEEAAIPEVLARQARPVGTISYTAQTENGIRADLLYLYDLHLPADFRPVNSDGEVAEFLCLPLDEVARLVRETEEFKLNSAVVVIDYLIRHGYLTPDDIPEYPTLCRDIRRIHPLLGQ